MTLAKWADHLYTIYPAPVDMLGDIEPFVTPALLDLLEKHSELIVATSVIHVPGKRKLQCIKSALTYALTNPTSVPYIGFAAYLGGLDATEVCWCFRSCCVEPDGTVIDSSFSPWLVAMYGVRFGREVFDAMKRPGAAHELPKES